eukprot:TRINITY_DN13159_c0_g1_i5.p1 TRINITY_DN13159_c0_g1~~TRINITY_DN13159_c0_g1_i5.p1  ORF type:complete len:658 (+),score=108.73 TRINITY_DN13159_c0_g1_i5:128-2101(+)
MYWNEDAVPQDGSEYNDFLSRQRNFDGKRMRKPVVRKTIDFNSSVARLIHARIWQRDHRDRPELQPTVDYVREFQSASNYVENPSNALCTKYVSTSVNKVRCPINAVAWTPDGRRLITGAHSGELTLWNGLTFNFETILQAHDDPIRCMVWSHFDEWLVTADDVGVVKFWQSSMNNTKAFQAHKDPIRDICFSPSDAKLATGADDGSIKVWDFGRVQLDRKLTGHGWDVKTLSWHPDKGLLASGSKDTTIKLWDPRATKCLSTLQGHKNTVSRLRWSPQGNYFVSGSRDQLIKLWDLRMLKEFQTCKGHVRDITALAWHPQQDKLFCSGSFDGSMMFWLVGDEECVAEVRHAHDNSVWDVAWHPLGHLLCSGSNDHTTRFWTRNFPGDEMKDKYNVHQLPAEVRTQAYAELAEVARNTPNRFGRDRTAYEQALSEQSVSSSLSLVATTSVESSSATVIPGLGSSSALKAASSSAHQQQVHQKVVQQMQQQQQPSSVSFSASAPSLAPPAPSAAPSSREPPAHAGSWAGKGLGMPHGSHLPRHADPNLNPQNIAHMQHVQNLQRQMLAAAQAQALAQAEQISMAMPMAMTMAAGVPPPMWAAPNPNPDHQTFYQNQAANYQYADWEHDTFGALPPAHHGYPPQQQLPHPQQQSYYYPE